MGTIAKTAAVELGAGQHMFGIPGLTTGAVGIMTMILGGIIIWYVRGMADRRRADNETVTAQSGASDVLFNNLSQEVKRLTDLVERQDKKIAAQDKRISELERDLADERMQRLGEMKNSIQVDLAASSLLRGDDR